MKPIQHSKPFIGKEEIDAAASVVASGQLAQGPMVEKLEAEWCRLTQKRHAAAVGSGLGAIRLALISLGVATGDEVIRLLEELNARGVTLILVTHDASIGARARRQLRMEDGAVMRDSAALVE